MYHPKSEKDILYGDTFPLPENKPETAEELGRQLLLKHKIADTDIEAHYHARSYPTPEGYDVHEVTH